MQRLSNKLFKTATSLSAAGSSRSRSHTCTRTSTNRFQCIHPKRSISFINKAFIDTPKVSVGTNTNVNVNAKQVQKDLDRAIKLVQKYDPAGYLPGLLVSNEARIGYFAVRAFWIDSGLRFMEEPLTNSISKSKQIAGVGQKGIEISNEERLRKWNHGIQSLFHSSSSDSGSSSSGSGMSRMENEDENEKDMTVWQSDPTLRLLHHVMQQHTLSKDHFDRILLGREVDVNTQQYSTVDSLKNHVEMSCGSLLYLILECANIYQNHNGIDNTIIYKAAKHIGIAHGLSNALRLSVPKASSTGKVIVPQDLCDKYDVKSPRYLLSALGMGDEDCRRHLQSAVEDIAVVARTHLQEARMLRNEIVSLPNGGRAISAFLPSLTAETFLNRLEEHEFDLTDRQLRNVGFKEHCLCSMRVVQASYTNTY